MSQYNILDDLRKTARENQEQQAGNREIERIRSRNPNMSRREIGEMLSSQQRRAQEDLFDQELMAQDRERIRRDRQKGMREGKQFAGRFFSAEQERSGMVDANMTPEMQDILSRRQQGLGGLSAAENQAAREQAFREVQARNQGDTRGLRARLGTSGLRGAAAAAAEMELAKDQAGQAVNLEQRLLLDNVNLRNQALRDYESTLGSQREDLLRRQTMNIGRADQFRSGRAGSELGFAGLAAGERGETLGKLLGEKGIEAVRQSGGGGKKHICGELKRRGLLSGEDYADMTVLSLRAIFKYGRFSAWYFKNARKMIDKINKTNPNYNWANLRMRLVSPALELLREGKNDAAAHHYGYVLQALDWEFNYGEWESFKSTFFSGGSIRNIFGWVQVLMMPDFWKTVRKFSKVWVLIQLRRAKSAI